MTDENNKNIENNQEENQNKPGENKLLGLKPSYGLRTGIIKNILLFLITVCIISTNSYFNISYAKETDLQKGEVNLIEKEIKKTNKIGHWYSASKMKNKYSHHIAVLLPNGNVFIRGIRTAEIYNPQKDSYENIESVRPISIRAIYGGHKLMADGKLLFFFPPLSNEVSMEVYNYKTGKFEQFDDSYLPGPLYTKELYYKKQQYISEIVFLSDKLMLVSYNKKTYLYDYIKKTYKEIHYQIEIPGSTSSYMKIGNTIYFINVIGQRNETSNKIDSIRQIVKYNLDENRFETVNLGKISGPMKPIFLDNYIYFFTGSLVIDSNKERDKIRNSPIYRYDIKNNNYERIGALYSGGSTDIESVVLKDGRILFNSGRFSGNYVEHEIFDPASKTSVFTEKRPWYKRCKMTLLEDGSVLKTGGWVIRQERLYGTKNSERYYP